MEHSVNIVAEHKLIAGFPANAPILPGRFENRDLDILRADAAL